VRRHLDARTVRPFARSLPWPYNGMVNDLASAIQSGSNFLAALGLATYTEVCGRQIVFGGNSRKSYDACFNSFLEYMGVQEVLNWKIVYQGQPKKVKDAVRNGLVHEYFLKAHRGSVAMITTNKDADHLGFIRKGSDELIMIVVPYFKLFCAALRKAKAEGKLTWK
jgi:hypothetical protein